MGVPQFILASASPARRRLLQSIGIDPIVRPSQFDESQVQLSDPAELVKKLSFYKAETVAAELSRNGLSSPALVIGCDSVLAIHGEIHGKPASSADAIARWQQMRGQIGSLYTGHTLLKLLPNQRHATPYVQCLIRCQITHVHFAMVSDRQIEAYVATGEPFHCAGCFALEGKGGLFVEKLDGCHSNVIGLSLPLLRRMLDELGYNATDLWES